MNHQVIIVFLCYSVNPFIRKTAITKLNDYTGYAIIQFTTTIGNCVYLFCNQHMLSLEDATFRHLQYSIGSSALTVLSSYHMTKLLKQHSVSSVTSQIQVLTIVTSFFVDYFFNNKILTHKQLFGILFMISGIILSNI
jgi:uncharacterized membrane protein